MRALAPRERRLVALLILIGLLALVQTLVVAPWFEARRTRAATFAQLTLQYAANERLTAAIPRFRAVAEQQARILAPLGIAAATPDEGGAILIDRVERTVEAVGGETRASENLSEGEAARVRASARVTLAQLVELLARLQNVAPYLTIDQLDIAADQAVVSGRLEPWM